MAITLKEFEELVANHDMSYAYSDDHRCYTNGHLQYRNIMREAEKLPHEDVVRIWNAQVEKNFTERAWTTFYMDYEESDET
jgi:hypothetical protein